MKNLILREIMLNLENGRRVFEVPILGKMSFFWVAFIGLNLIVGGGEPSNAQAVVGQMVSSTGGQVQGISTQYGGGYVLTNNGLLTYEFYSGGRASNSFLPTGFINLNELTVNLAQTTIPTGRLNLNKIIGKNGDRIILSWKLE